MADLRMPEINNVILAGNLTRDPVYKTNQHGNSLIHFTIASNRRYKDKQNMWKEDVCFVNVVARNKLADSCDQRLKKGYGVLVEGELQRRKWKTKQGTSHYVVEIKARRIQFLDKTASKQLIIKDIESIEKEEKSAERNPPVDGIRSTNNEEEKPLSFEDDHYNQFISNEESELRRRDSSDT